MGITTVPSGNAVAEGSVQDDQGLVGHRGVEEGKDPLGGAEAPPEVPPPTDAVHCLTRHNLLEGGGCSAKG